MTTVHLTFVQAVALAGLGYLAGALLVHHSGALRRWLVPEPLLGGAIVGLVVVALRAGGLVVQWPTSGRSVDFLVALLTANMGLHVTPGVLRAAWRLGLLFLGLAVALYLAQFLAALPLAMLGPEPVRTALLAPVSFVGAPFNLNPPHQMALVSPALAPLELPVDRVARGMQAVGVLVAVVLPGVLGRALYARIPGEPPSPKPGERGARSSLAMFAFHETAVVVLVLALVAVAFAAQDVILRAAPELTTDHVPVIVLAYLCGVAARLVFELVRGPGHFAERALTVLLLGPTMSLVLAYAVMSVPLHHIAALTPRLAAITAVGVALSAGMAWLGFRIFARVARDYYAAVVAVAFFAATTAWGPVAMSYLRRSTAEEGPVEPMPAVLPLNAFYVFPWVAALLAHWLARLAG